MKKKIVKQVSLVSLFISMGITSCVAVETGIINIADLPPSLTATADPPPGPPPGSMPPPGAGGMPPPGAEGMPPPGAGGMPPPGAGGMPPPGAGGMPPPGAGGPPPGMLPPGAALPPGAGPGAPMPPGAAPHPGVGAHAEEVKIDYNKPLLPKTQFFEYRCLKAANVNLTSLKAMDCDRLKLIYEEDPQRAVDHVSLLLLVNRTLQGSDVINMPPEDRVDLAYATILGELRKYGRINEARGYMGLSYGECRDRIAIPTVAALCQVLEGVKGAIILELYHYKKIFPGA